MIPSPIPCSTRPIATFEDDAGAYDQKDAAGFIKLNALRLRIAQKLARNKKRSGILVKAVFILTGIKAAFFTGNYPLAIPACIPESLHNHFCHSIMTSENDNQQEYT